MNNVSLIGRIYNQKETIRKERFLAISFSLGVRAIRKDKDGEYKLNFLNCKAFNKTAEMLLSMERGSQVGITGSIEIDEFINKAGEDKKIVYVVANSISFINSKEAQNQPKDNQQTINQSTNFQSKFEPINTLDISDEDLPF
jgi:single-strand DNA-binding protein